MLTYEEALARLTENRDEGYRVFQQRLLKNDAVRVLGVRVPVLRRLAQKWRGETEALFSFPDEYYEILFLKCIVAGGLPFAQFCGAAERLVPLLDNWATCDSFAAPCIEEHREEFLPCLERYIADPREFTERYALVTLLRYYMEEEYLPLIFSCAERCDKSLYYVSMACAWLIAETLVKFYGAGTAFLKRGTLDRRTHNKALQKARESFRLSGEQKAELTKLRR